VPLDRAAEWHDEASEHMQQGGLPGARSAEKRKAVLGDDLEIDLVQRPHDLVGAAVGDGDTAARRERFA